MSNLRGTVYYTVLCGITVFALKSEAVCLIKVKLHMMHVHFCKYVPPWYFKLQFLLQNSLKSFFYQFQHELIMQITFLFFQNSFLSKTIKLTFLFKLNRVQVMRNLSSRCPVNFTRSAWVSFGEKDDVIKKIVIFFILWKNSYW